MPAITIKHFDINKLSLDKIEIIANKKFKYQRIPIKYDDKDFYLVTPPLKSAGVIEGDYGGYSIPLACFENMGRETKGEQRFYDVIEEITTFIRAEVKTLFPQIKENGSNRNINVDNLLICKPNSSSKYPDGSPTIWAKLFVNKFDKSIKSVFYKMVNNEPVKTRPLDYVRKHCYVRVLLAISDVYIGSSGECIRFTASQVTVKSLIDTRPFDMGPDMPSDSEEEEEFEETNL